MWDGIPGYPSACGIAALCRAYYPGFLQLIHYAPRTIIPDGKLTLDERSGTLLLINNQLGGIFKQRVKTAHVHIPQIAACVLVYVFRQIESRRIALLTGYELCNLCNLRRVDKCALHTNRISSLQEQHITATNELIGSRPVKDSTGIHHRRYAKSDTRRKVGFDRTCNDIRRRTLRSDNHVYTLAQRREQLEAELAHLTEEQAALTTDLYAARKSAEDLQDESTAELEASIQSIEETNRKVRVNLEKARAEDEAAKYASDYDKLTDAIEQKRKERLALLNGADLPLPELSVEDGALTYKGKRWRDMSGSDQLRVAAAIVRRLNPDCGFVLLDKLEQMDMTTLEEFGRWLEAEGLQAIATRVSTGSECQIIIEDGMVKGADLPVLSAAPTQTRTWTKGAF